jgi:hypothetical protein
MGLLALAGVLCADYAYGFGRNGGLFGRFFNRNSGGYRYRERGNFNNESGGPQVQQVQYQDRRFASPYPEDNGLCQNCPNGNCNRGQATVGWDPQVAQVEYLPNGGTYDYATTQPLPVPPVDPGYGIENRIERDRLAVWYRNQGIDPRRAYWYRNRDEGNLDAREAYWWRNRDEGNLDAREAYYLRNRDDRNWRAIWYANQDRDWGRYALINDRRGCDSFGLPIPDARGRLDNLDARLLALEGRTGRDFELRDRVSMLEGNLSNGMVAILRDREGREIRRTRFGTACPLCLTLESELVR